MSRGYTDPKKDQFKDLVIFNNYISKNNYII